MPLHDVMLSTLQNNPFQGILIVDVHGKVLYFNQQMRELWKIPSSVLDTGDDQKLLEIALSKLKDPDSFMQRVEYLYHHPKEECHDVLCLKDETYLERFSTPLTDQNGQYHGRIWYFQDITEKERNRQMLQESQARFLELFENMSDAFALHKIVVDENNHPIDYEFIECNNLFLKRLGMTREQLIHHRAKELFPRTEQTWIENFCKVAQTGEPFHFVNYAVELDRYYETHIYCPRQGYFAGLFTDVTEIKKIEKAREKLITDLEVKNNELERFAYSASHDLRTPLVSIQGYCAEALSSIQEGRIQDAVSEMQFIYSASLKMGTLLSGLLGYSRAGRSLEISAFHMNDVIQVALANLQDALDRIQPHIEVNIDSQIIYGDRHRITTIWQNLLENAIKYRKATEPLHITLGSVFTDNVQWYFIKDNGIGIAPKFHKKVFDLFDKLDSASPGAGAGLAIAKRIVEAHHGTIRIESSENAGCTIFFSLSALDNAHALPR